MQENYSEPTKFCRKCHALLPLSQLRRHVGDCSVKEDTSRERYAYELAILFSLHLYVNIAIFCATISIPHEDKDSKSSKRKSPTFLPDTNR